MRSEERFERLASIEHDRWSDWMKYLFSKCEKRGKGLLIPQEFVDRWQRQIDTKYKDLSESEKESDREQVLRYWDLVT